ncbi:MAG: IS66 family transposase [Thermoguttaceae bacterium]
MARCFTEEDVRRLIEEAVAPLKARIAELEAENERLKVEIAKLRKNSTTSSKPPSSDIVKPPRPPMGSGRRGKRRPGGQPGHARHIRPAFPPEQVDQIRQYELPIASPGWRPLDQFRVVQQVELVEKPYTVTEHRARLYENLRTGQVMAAPLPPEVRRCGLLGPRLTALVAYQKGACHMSVETIRRFLGDVFGLPISHGQVMKAVRKVSESLAFSHEELANALPRQAYMGIDETGHREQGRGLWSWCFHVPGEDRFTWFHIDPSRGSKVLKQCLGEAFGGIVGCDYFSAYRKFLRETDVWLQLCWAHLIRDVKYLTTLVDRVTCNYGHRLLDKIRTLFRTWHRRGQAPTTRWHRAIAQVRADVLAVAKRAPMRTEAQNMAKRFRDHGDAYFTFLDTPGIEPTNNGPERQIRLLAIDRKITQGTRGEAGRRWCERIWTVLATCAQQNRSAFAFIHDSVIAHFTHQPPPSLLPQPP